MQNSIGTQQKQKITAVIIQNCARYIIILANNKSPIKQIDYNYVELTLKYLYKNKLICCHQTNEIETRYILEGSCNKLKKKKKVTVFGKITNQLF